MKTPTLFKLASTSMLAIALFFCFQSTSFASKRDTAESKRYFKQGQSYFENGEYAEALASFQMAYHYKKLTGFHFNMAQCQMELGDYKRALKNYRTYLDAKPGASNTALVEARILEAKSKLGLLKPKPKPKMKKIAKTAAAPKTKAKSPTKRAKAKPKASPKKRGIAATPSASKPASAKSILPAAPPPPSATVNTTEPTLIPLIRAQAKITATAKPSKSKTAAKASNPKPPKEAAIGSSHEAEVIVATLDTGAPNADLLATQPPPEDLLASAPPSSSMDEPIYEEWWFWSITGSVVAASVGAIIYAASGDSEPVVMLPSGSLGRIDRR